jgi:pimeloyl-ACP methyl ester carboxylesterase
LRFDNYIQDAIGWIKFLKATQKFTTITVVGHSEGSLIGMIAAQNENVSKIVSIAGPTTC